MQFIKNNEFFSAGGHKYVSRYNFFSYNFPRIVIFNEFKKRGYLQLDR